MDICIGAAANIASEALKGIFKIIKRHIKYVTSYQEYVPNIEAKIDTLKAKRSDVKHEVLVATNNLRRIKSEVKLWCENVDKKFEEWEKSVKVLEDLEKKAKSKCFIGLCPNIKSRHQLSRKAEKDVTSFDELIRRGDQLISGGVATRDVHEATVDASPKDFDAFDSRKQVFEDVMKALKDPTISMIGVYGVGGVGKTTLVKEVARQAQEARLFDSVIMVAVSQIPNIQNIQDEIAESLDFKLEQKSTAVRASQLRKRLTLKKEKLEEERKILVVLDNIWVKLDLKEVGIPFGNDEGCKILLTSRDQGVLSTKMDVKITLAIGVLKENEAQDLFNKMVGDKAESPEFRSIAVEIAKRCGGLPLAIATIARSLRKKNLFAWNDALTKLKRPSPSNFSGISAEVYSALELSYHHLESDELKQTFLLCSLLGHDAYISDFLKYAMGLHLFDDVDTVEETRNRVLSLVSDLKASCLLRDSNYSNDCFDMHDLIRDVAISIAARDNNLFALKDGDVLEAWPDGEKIKKCTRINLRFARISEFPDNELNCPQLTFFYMSSKDSSVQIPSNFFGKMENLKVLDLTLMDFSSEVHVSQLPSSISSLKSLRTLCLDHCVLKDIAIIGELNNLEILSLLRSDIEMLPKEIGQLIKLRLLDLSNCTKLKIIPWGVLSNLSKLEELYMGNGFVQWGEDEHANRQRNASLAELTALSKLTTLHIHVRNAQIMPKDLLFENLQSYKIFIGDQAWDWFDKNYYSRSRTLNLKLNTSIHSLVDGVKLLLKKSEDLYLEDLKDVKILLELGGEGIRHLKNLHIRNGMEMQYVLDGNYDQVDKLEFLQLRSLTLESLPKLISFFFRNKRDSATIPQHESSLFNEQIVFPCLEDLQLISITVESIWLSNTSCFCTWNLKSLIIKDCGNLKHLLSSSMARSLVHLKKLEITECKGLREIIFTEDIEEENKVTISFPQLNSLKIKNLQNLIRFFSENHRIELPSLCSLEIMGCPKMKGFMCKSTMEENQALLDEKVALPCLEILRIRDIENIGKIWSDQLVGDSFCKLKSLRVCRCHKLLNIFSFDMRERLQNLEDFQIYQCDSLEVIFEPHELNANELYIATTTDFVFPDVTNLILHRLPKLKSFYSRIHTTKWPSLKKMWVYGCDKIETFASANLSFGGSTNQDPLFWVNEVTFPNLEELKLEWNDVMKEIWHGQLRAELFSKLKVLELICFPDESAVFPHCFIQSLPNLEKLVVNNSSFNEIFRFEGIDGEKNHGLAFTSLNELRTLEVLKCNKLNTLVPSSMSFENLTTLEVSRCHGLVSLIASSSAKSLKQLTKMSITECNMIEQIIACEGCEVKGGIVFTQLKYLQLSCLPSLASFCLGDHSFEFPLLEKVIVIGCPKMEIFSQGDLSTKMLRNVQFTESEDEGCWEGNLNTTIQRLFTEKVGEYKPGHLKLSESSMLKELWRRNPRGILDLKSLKFLEVYDCSSLKYLFTLSMALDLAQLSKVEVKNCHLMEHIIAEEGTEENFTDKIIFPKLGSITLESCADLKSFYQGSRVLEFPSLIGIEVVDCLQMSAFSEEQRITETIDDGGNRKSLSQIAAAFFNNQVVFPKLNALKIEGMGNLTRIWHDKLTLDSFFEIQDIFVENCERLLNIFPFNMMERLDKLEGMMIRNCGSLEEIIGPHGLNSYESHEVTTSQSIVAETTPKFVFPKIEILILDELPKLKSFYPEIHTTEWPSLQHLVVHGCNKVEIIFAEEHLNYQEMHGKSQLEIPIQQPLFWVNEDTFPCLEEILSADNCLKEIWHGRIPTQYLRTLKVYSCGRLKTLVPSSVSFENLTTLEVSRCDGFINLLRHSTAKSMVHLTRMSITHCQMIEEIIACTNDEVNDDAIIFSQLKYLKLGNLPSLSSFCPGNFTFGFPSLEEVIMRQCPKMEIFSKGKLSTPMLQGIQSAEGEYVGRWEGNLNAIVQQLFIEKIFPSLEDLELCSINIQRIWNYKLLATFSYAQNLTCLTMEGCHNLNCLFSSSMVESFVQLRKLKIENCENMEKAIFIEELATEEMMSKKLFRRLESLLLKYLPKLTRFCNGSYIEFPLLRILRIERCPTLKTFISNAEGNNSGIVSPSLFNEKVAFPCLKELSIIGVGNWRKIWHDRPDQPTPQGFKLQIAESSDV